MKIHIVTGVAGFIGCNLASSLVARGIRVVGIDNFRLGSRKNIEALNGLDSFSFIESDLSSFGSISNIIESCGGYEVEALWHLAANSDIKEGSDDVIVDYRHTFTTSCVALELCDQLDIGHYLFASSSAVYGEVDGPLREDHTPMRPISNYGAMKLAAEALVGAYVEKGLPRATIFRFPNVVGAPATHGVIYDFFTKLLNDRQQLEVLGDGSQKKCYLHVSELIDAMLHCFDRSFNDNIYLVNIGPLDDGVTVKEIAERVVCKASPAAEIRYGDTNKGWIGDIPKFEFDINKISAAGWRPCLSSSSAIFKAIDEISQQFSDAD